MIKNIAAVISGMDEEYPYHIINGINDFAREHDLNVSYFAAFGGIIDSKEEAVREALAANGFEILESGHSEEWVSFTARKK